MSNYSTRVPEIWKITVHLCCSQDAFFNQGLCTQALVQVNADKLILGWPKGNNAVVQIVSNQSDERLYAVVEIIELKKFKRA